MSGTLIKAKNTLIGDRAFYKRVIAILIPIVIQNTFTNAVSFVDNIMVGQIGTLEMSAVATVNQLLFVFNLCIFGGLSGIGIFTAQFAGAKDQAGVRRTIRAKNYLALAMLIIGLAVFLAFPAPLIKLYISEDTLPEVAELMMMHSLDYMYIMLIGLAPFAISQVYGSTLREEGETKLPMIGGVVAILVNLVLNYILIYGNEGLPFLPFAPMGVTGAAIATVISRYVEMALLLIVTHTRKDKYPSFVGVYRTAKIPLPLCREMLVKGSPLLLNEFLWSSGMAILLQCYSVRGIECVAAANISSTVLNLFNVVCFSMGSAIAIILGQHLGADEVEEAKSAVWKLFALSVASCLVMGTALAACSGFIPDLYETEDSEIVRELASKMLLIVACTMPIFAFAHAVYFTLRSGGKTLMTFIFDCGFTWGVTIPFAFISAHYTSMGIIPLYLCVQLLDLTKCIVGYILIKKGVWINRIID